MGAIVNKMKLNNSMLQNVEFNWQYFFFDTIQVTMLKLLRYIFLSEFKLKKSKPYNCFVYKLKCVYYFNILLFNSLL
jgi:hypothetical protein